jgi:xylulokinase
LFCFFALCEHEYSYSLKNQSLQTKYSIGFDIGSSSIKAALYDIDRQAAVGVTRYPHYEMDVSAPHPNFAEQNPQDWWEYLCKATQILLQEYEINPHDILSIGLSYQMHGLVVIDKNHEVLRPAIIWCDSRAVHLGASAFDNIGHETCLSQILNSPGNFTASKLKWVQENEPELYSRIYKMMLPGDYIHMKLTGEINTTIAGLSEAMLWDFSGNKLAQIVLDYYRIDKNLIPDLVPNLDIQGVLSAKAAAETGLAEGTKVSYRAGDQPNNALSLNVMRAGEVAATGGTSGVVYALSNKLVSDTQSRINNFAHVNHSHDQPMIGSLLCINGAGIQYAWLRQQIANAQEQYSDLERKAAKIPIGADGLRIIPFGNGAERIMGDKSMGAQINNIQFNRHTQDHIFRAGLEGIAFSFVYGCEYLINLGINVGMLKCGNDNLFQSSVFSSTIATLLDCAIEIYDTTGAIGAAKASLIGAKIDSVDQALGKIERVRLVESSAIDIDQYSHAYQLWKSDLHKLFNTP